MTQVQPNGPLVLVHLKHNLQLYKQMEIENVYIYYKKNIVWISHQSVNMFQLNTCIFYNRSFLEEEEQ